MTRINIGRSNKLGYAAVIGLEGYARKSVDPDLYELIKLRASILNGCGFCVDMHATDGRKRGIPSRKLHAVAAWQHSKVFFDAREQAVLALTDAVTQLGPGDCHGRDLERCGHPFRRQPDGWPDPRHLHHQRVEQDRRQHADGAAGR